MSDDPTDKTRLDFGVTGDGLHIPFHMQGTTVYFNSRVPMPWEYEQCRIIELTVDKPWNPAEVNISAAASSALTMEQVKYQNICAMDRIPRCANEGDEQCSCRSDLSVFEPASLFSGWSLRCTWRLQVAKTRKYDLHLSERRIDTPR